MGIFNPGTRTRDVRSIVADAKDTFVGTVDGAGRAGAVVDSVSEIMVRALRGTDPIGVEVLVLGTAAVTGVVHGAAEVGGAVCDTANSIMVGALRGTQRIGRTTVATVSANAAALVKATSEVGGSVTEAAKGAVEGAIEAAPEIGMSSAGAAAAAATGALRAAGEISVAAMDQVRSVLTGTISGVAVAAKEPSRIHYRIEHAPLNGAIGWGTSNEPFDA